MHNAGRQGSLFGGYLKAFLLGEFILTIEETALSGDKQPAQDIWLFHDETEIHF